MEQTKKASAAEINKIEATRDAIKDAGLVRFGAGNIQFSDPTPAHEATKDAGRVRMGAGNIQF